jgi:hypothetical protein
MPSATPAHTTLTEAQVAEFRAHGFLHLPAAFAAADAAAIAKAIWRHLREKNGVDRDDPSTWDRSWDGIQPVASRPLFQRIASARLRGAIDQLVGADNWTPPRRWNMIRASPPKPATTPWSVPAAGWHHDAAPGTGLMLFILFSDLHPRGGGTLVVTGAHRLLAPFLADPRMAALPCRAQKARFVAAHPWLARLTGLAPRSAHGLEFLVPERDADGVELSVREITGAAGDVIICPAETWHVAPSHHAGAPRCLSIKVLRTRRPVWFGDRQAAEGCSTAT